MKSKILIIAIVLVIITGSAIGVSMYANQRISTNVTVYYENEDIYEDSPYEAIITQKRVMVPLQHTFDYFGWEEGAITVFPDGQHIHFQGGDSSCTFVLGEKTVTRFWSDGSQETTYMDVAPMKVDGIFYIPLRAYCEIWNEKITWNKSDKTVHIEMNRENEKLEREYEYKKETATYVEPVPDSSEKYDYILGTYMHPKYPENYSVTVLEHDGDTITFDVEAIQSTGTFAEIRVTEKIVNNVCNFSFTDNFDNTGTGILTINADTLTISFNVPKYNGHWCIDAAEGSYVSQKPKNN